MKMLENLQDDFDFNYKTLKSQGGKAQLTTLLPLLSSVQVMCVFSVPLPLLPSTPCQDLSCRG